MTIRELRDILTQLPEDISLDLPVLVKGYEGGYKDLLPSAVGIRAVCLNWRDNVDYTGPHELVADLEWFADDEELEGKTISPALILDRSPLEPI